jgi:5-methyltetrahydrofolate--homocysteine methyltransferase
LRDTVNVIVGGAPVNEEFAEKIKADGYSPDAPSAVQLIESFTSE